MNEQYLVVKVGSKKSYSREHLCRILDRLINCGLEDAQVSEEEGLPNSAALEGKDMKIALEVNWSSPQ